MKVLVVDDSMTIRAQVGRALRAAGFETVEATDGLDALNKVGAPGEINLVVCDVNMPRMNGVEFLEQAFSGKAAPPIIMLTTEGQAALIAQAKALGAKVWILKPFKADVLVGAAKKLTGMAA